MRYQWLLPDGIRRIINIETKGLEGEALASKALEMCERYGTGAVFNINVDKYLREGDKEVYALPCEELGKKKDRVGFSIQHILQDEQTGQKSHSSYTLEGETLFFPRLPKIIQDGVDKREAQHVFDTEHVRVYISDGTPTSGYFYSPDDDEVKDVTVTFDARHKSISIAVNDDKHKDADVVAKDIAGLSWGRHNVSSTWSTKETSPEGLEFSLKDLQNTVMKAEEVIEPVITMARAKDLHEMERALSQAISENVKERGLSIEDTTKGRHAIR